MEEEQQHTSNKESLLATLDSTIRGGFYILAFLTPLFFLPVTPDFFEFNKQGLLVALTIILLALWSIKTIIRGAIRIQRSSFSFAWILILVAMALATFFSRNRVAGILGRHGTWQPSLVSAVCYFILFQTAVSNLKKKDLPTLAEVIVGGGGVASLIGLLSVFRLINTLLPYPWTQSQSFNTVGGIVPLAVVAALTVVFSLGGLVFSTPTPLKKKKILLYTFSAIASGVFLALTLVPSALLVAGAGAFWLIVLTISSKVRSNFNHVKYYVITCLTVGVIAALIGLTPKVAANFNLRELAGTQTDLKSSWVVASSTLRDAPLWGSGPGSFRASFDLYRPVFLNNTPEWTRRFNQASNEYLTLLTTTGLIGLLAGLVFLFKVSSTIFPKREEAKSPLFDLFVLTILSGYLFAPAQIITQVMLTFALAGVVVSRITAATPAAALAGFRRVLPFAALALSAVGGYGLYRVYMGEHYQMKSIFAYNGGDLIQAYNHQQTAIQFNPYWDIYHSNNAILNLEVALALLRGGDGEQASQLISAAVEESNVSIQLNPLSTRNWITRGNIYQSLVGTAEGALQWARAAYSNATLIDPTDPLLHLNLGQLFLAEGKNIEAIRSFVKAVSQKSDLIETHYYLSHALSANNNLAEAVAEMGVALRLANPDWDIYTPIKTELEALIEQYNQTLEQGELPLEAQTASGETIPPASPGETEFDLTPQEATPSAGRE